MTHGALFADGGQDTDPSPRTPLRAIARRDGSFRPSPTRGEGLEFTHGASLNGFGGWGIGSIEEASDTWCSFCRRVICATPLPTLSRKGRGNNGSGRHGLGRTVWP